MSNSEAVTNQTGWHWFLTPKCKEILIDNLDPEGECLQLFASKIISYIIIFLTVFFVKVPQIMKIINNESAQGVSFTSQVLLLITSSATVSYSVAKRYPLSTWAESAVLCLQILLLGWLILVYSGKKTISIVFVIIYFIMMMVMLTPAVPMQIHIFLQFLSVPMNGTSKVIQIVTNVKNRSTGQLSATSIFITNLRSIGRLFSIYIETGDPYRLALFAQASILNLVLSSQILYYKKSAPNKRD